MTDRVDDSFKDTSETTTDDQNVFPRRLAPGLWVLGNSYFNLYLVKGEQASALVEVGVSATVDEVINQMESLNIRPDFLVVTHPHADHVTGLEGLKERYIDVMVVAGENAPEFLNHPKAGQAIAPEDKHMSEFLRAQGYEPDRPPLTDPPSLAECMIARDGDEMDLGGVTLRFLEVNGHAPGSINVYIPQLEALIASDSLGFRFERRGFYPLFFTSFSDHMQTLERLHQLHPKILCVAHQGPRTGSQVEEDFRQARDAAQRLRDTIVADTRDDGEIAQDIFDDTYADEYLLYTKDNIMRCGRLLVRRAKQDAGS